jgi:ribosome-associated heat shock protein Hsp15
VTEQQRVRLDRWLWAARFFKTRSAAKRALETGKIRCDGQRPKASREVGEGTQLTIERAGVEYTVVVTGIAQRRGTAGEAAALYSETEQSVVQRKRQAEQLRLYNQGVESPPSRPNSRDRAAIKRLKQFSTEPDAS